MYNKIDCKILNNLKEIIYMYVELCMEGKTTQILTCPGNPHEAAKKHVEKEMQASKTQLTTELVLRPLNMVGSQRLKASGMVSLINHELQKLWIVWNGSRRGAGSHFLEAGTWVLGHRNLSSKV